MCRVAVRGMLKSLFEGMLQSEQATYRVFKIDSSDKDEEKRNGCGEKKGGGVRVLRPKAVTQEKVNSGAIDSK